MSRIARVLSVAVAVVLSSQAEPVWKQDDFTGKDGTKPAWFASANPRVSAIHADGCVLIADKGTIQGDMVTARKGWCADPVTGSSVVARVKVVSCEGLAGVMIGFSDGTSGELLTLHTDHIELYRAKLTHKLDTTDGFHEYRVDIKGNDVAVSVDGKQVIDGKGAFTFPAHGGRNRLSIGGGASLSTGEAYWDWLRWTDGSQALRDRFPVVPGAEQVVVYKKKGVYAPFPGVCMDPKTGTVYASFSRKTVRTHNETLDARGCLMASTDGGLTWQQVPKIPAGMVGDRPSHTSKLPDGALGQIGQNWRKYYPPERLPEFEGKYRIIRTSTHKPNWFAVNSGGWAGRSEDGGKTWQKTPIAGLDSWASCSSPWSSIQLQDGRCLRSFMVVSGKKDSGDVYVAMTRDGKTTETVRVMGDPEEKLRFTEETLAHQTSKGVIWLLTRVEGGDDHLYQAISRDNGKTWSSRKSGILGHPPSGLVKLPDGRLVLTYGHRHPPYGIRAVVSKDEGLTWDTENTITLRNDGAGYDLGYPRSLLLKDGSILTVYYFTQDDQVTHVAATRWRVP
jgi:sialidase-1